MNIVKALSDHMKDDNILFVNNIIIVIKKLLNVS